jgi:hypothetical protein
VSVIIPIPELDIFRLGFEKLTMLKALKNSRRSSPRKRSMSGKVPLRSLGEQRSREEWSCMGRTF